MEKSGIPYVKGKTWTTDAFYRETINNFEIRKADGCISVEMECSAIQAMCDFRNLNVYMFLTCGDCWMHLSICLEMGMESIKGHSMMQVILKLHCRSLNM